MVVSNLGLNGNKLVKDLIEEEVEEVGYNILSKNPTESKLEFDIELENTMRKRHFPTSQDFDIYPLYISAE